MRKPLFSIIFTFFSVYISLAQSLVVLQADEATKYIEKNVAILQSEAEHLNIDAILQQKDNQHWLSELSVFPIGGFSKHDIWLKAYIQNSSSQAAILEFSSSIFDSINIYQVNNAGAIVWTSQIGHKTPYNNALNNANQTLRLPYINEATTYYIHLACSFPNATKIRIGSFSAFAEVYRKEDTIVGMFWGIVLIIALINFSFSYAQKDKVYFWYAVYLVSISSGIAVSDGYWQFLTKGIIKNNVEWGYIILSSIGLFAAHFSYLFLETKTYLPKYHKYLVIQRGYFLFTLLFAIFINPLWGSILGYVFALPAILPGIYWGYLSIKQGRNVAYFFTIGWLALLLSISYYVLETLDIINATMPPRFMSYLGIGIEALVLTLGVAYRVQLLRLEQEKAQKLALQTMFENERIVREQNQILEQKVCERTAELSESLRRENEREKTLENYAQKLEKSNNELTEFAHIVSHDLKAPLRSIGSFTQILFKKNAAKFDTADNEYITFVTTGVRQATQLIDDLLNYSKIDKNIGESQPIDLEDVMRLVEFNLATAINEKKATIIRGKLPILQGHLSLLSQLFSNLITNGIKYNQSDTPSVSVGYEIRKNKTVFFVKDNGIGIPQEYKDEVFRMFRRLHTSDKYEGTGIGLAFCKRIVETYNGEIWLESEKEVGTTFFFTLPNAPIIAASIATNIKSKAA